LTIWHWYHVFAVDGWERIVGEHLDALESSGLSVNLRLGVVGTVEARQAVIDRCRQRMQTDVVAEADEGFEQVTLSALKADPSDAVLYAHTKGASVPNDFNDAWRRSMTRAVVGRWRECIELLETHEAVGPHWLTKEAWPQWVEIPYFGGNFWWTRREVIERLPEPRTDGRYWAEAWLGQANPTVYDLTPGWPGWGSFR